MGFDLSGRGGDFRWTGSAWGRRLEIAQENGWQPIGTGPGRGTLKKDWCGAYHSNDAQLFYARDAKHFAAALERFLQTISGRGKPKQKKTPDMPNAYFLTRDGQDSLREFIAYCREGSFRLY